MYVQRTSLAAESGTGSTQESGSGSSSMVDKNMFLQLLVAQLKNQDPLNPADGLQFVTQLAQFQQLEQGINMQQDLAAIRAVVESLSAARAATERV